jgi:hypothetical protein
MLTPTRGPDGSRPASTPAAPPQPTSTNLAQGNLASIQDAGRAAAAAAPANVATADAQTAFAGRVSELIAGGMSPGAAVTAAAQAVAQLGAATTRSGPATPAEALGDSLATGGDASSSGSPALAAALAKGQSPAQAIAAAAAAARQQEAMQAAASVPIGQAASGATAMGNGDLPANVPNPGAFVAALASGASPDAAMARSAIAGQTLAAMQARATLPDTPARQVASGFAAGDLSSLPGIGGNATGEAALAAALGRGDSLEDALAAAARAMASRAEQDQRGTVAISEQDAGFAAMAQGSAPADSAGAAQMEQQLQSAAVQANADATALAQGQVPPGDTDPDVTGRLLRHVSDPDALVRQLTAWAAALEQQEQAARITPRDEKAALIERFAQGRATPEDIAEILRQARSGTLAGITQWLLGPTPDAAAVPQADRGQDPGTGG